MATITQHDTYPPLRGLASDGAGPVDLSVASSLEVIVSDGVATITGTAVAVQPPVTNSDGDTYNWEYQWAAGDTAVASSYEVQLKVTWDAGTTPPHVEYFPNGANPTLTIKAALA